MALPDSSSPSIRRILCSIRQRLLPQKDSSVPVVPFLGRDNRASGDLSWNAERTSHTRVRRKALFATVERPATFRLSHAAVFETKE